MTREQSHSAVTIKADAWRECLTLVVVQSTGWHHPLASATVEHGEFAGSRFFIIGIRARAHDSLLCTGSCGSFNGIDGRAASRRQLTQPVPIPNVISTAVVHAPNEMAKTVLAESSKVECAQRLAPRQNLRRAWRFAYANSTFRLAIVNSSGTAEFNA